MAGPEPAEIWERDEIQAGGPLPDKGFVTGQALFYPWPIFHTEYSSYSPRTTTFRLGSSPSEKLVAPSTSATASWTTLRS